MTTEHLVELWLAGYTMAAIAEEAGCTVAAVGSRVHYLRKIGVKLPRRHVGSGLPVDVAAMNRLITNHQRGGKAK